MKEREREIFFDKRFVLVKFFIYWELFIEEKFTIFDI